MAEIPLCVTGGRLLSEREFDMINNEKGSGLWYTVIGFRRRICNEKYTVAPWEVTG